MGGHNEIFLYDGTSTTQLTNDFYGKYSPQINDSAHMVWRGCGYSACDIFLYDGASTTNISNNTTDVASQQMNDRGEIVWSDYVDGGWWGGIEDPRIFLAVPCSLDNDNDADGYVSASCGGDDCADGAPDINPGMTEIPGNGYDDDCDPTTPAYPEPANTMAASYGRTSLVGSGVFNSLSLLLVPVGGVILLRILRRKR